MPSLSSLWKDGLPGLIAAGLLAAAASVFLPTTSLLIPMTGFLAATTVYVADHHLLPDNPSSITVWVFISISSCLLGIVILGTGLFRPLVAVLYVLLSLGYVLNLPGTRFRLQNHPWIRPGLISMGWACIPFLLRGLSLEPRSLAFTVGTSGLFFSSVFWSDRNDLEEDRSRGRITPVQILSRSHIDWLIVAGYLTSILGYVVGDLTLFAVPAGTGLVLMMVNLHSILVRYGDILLLWFGVAAIVRHLG